MHKDIALVIPRSTFLESKMTFPSLGALYLASRLESFGHRTELFDLNEDELPRDGDFSQLWISSTAPQVAEVKRIARETSSWTKTKTCLGGAAVWASPTQFKNLGFDMAIGGEADQPEATQKIVELVDKPNDDHYAFFPVSKTLDWVLPPLRRWAHRYNAYFTDTDGITYNATTSFHSRGCGFSCAFCESGRRGIVWSDKVRFEPLEIVEHQIKEIKEQGFGLIAVYDDVAIFNKTRTLAIMELNKKYGMKWRGFIRTDLIRRNGGKSFLEELKMGGCVEMFIGVESASNSVKAAIQKGNTIEDDTLVVQWAKELGIKTKCSFILGLPSESHESMEKTREWIFRMRPDRVQCGRMIPFEGTPLFSRREEYDIKYDEQPPDEWFYSGDNGLGTRSFVSTSHLTRDEIDLFWHDLMAQLKEEGIPS